MSVFAKYLTVFGMSMMPVIELRGSIPYGVAMGLNYPLLFLLSIMGNMLPVPFIILFIRRIFAWMKTKSAFLTKIALRMENKAIGKSEIIKKYEMLGLAILVAIPLPGTGAWTGALVAAIFDLRIKYSVFAIFIGVLVAGIIMTCLSYGIGMFF